MNRFLKFSLVWKAFWQLGFRQSAWYAWYQVLLRSGYLRRVTASPPAAAAFSPDWEAFRLPDAEKVRGILGPQGLQRALILAEEIVAGKVRLFGGPPVALDFSLPSDVPHWTQCDTADILQRKNLPDVKYLWEPARFGWVFTLGRAYLLTENPVYARAFWEFTEAFWRFNLPYRGPNWESGQEVALRLMSLAWGGAVFASAPESTPQRMARLTASLLAHAVRIPPTLPYARAQNNNHLLSEAVGLLTAARLFPTHPQASRWRALGMRWWRWGLRHQIFADGEYTQHSTNYHRLMLQLALWVAWLIPEATDAAGRQALGRATRWLLSLCDVQSGGVPNLGPNDGAYIFPLSVLPFEDYRPVLQAAARAFLGENPFPPGRWDEMSAWFALPPQSDVSHGGAEPSGKAGYLRAVPLRSRPGHADQLHFDLHHAGRYLLLDAGTYLYNAPPPWDNALTHAAVHNTVTVDARDQMLRAGRFLYLDWAQGRIIEQRQAPTGDWEHITAGHDGYRRLGIFHQRTVTVPDPGRWVIEDRLIGADAVSHAFRLHWLVADGDWRIDDGQHPAGDGWLSPDGGQDSAVATCVFTVHLPEDGPFLRLVLRAFVPALDASARSPLVTLARAGELLYGTGRIPPVRGWYSPTYGVKLPALSLALKVWSAPPVRFVTEITVHDQPPQDADRI